MLKVNIQLCVKVLLDRELLRNIIGAVRSVNQCTFPMTILLF